MTKPLLSFVELKDLVSEPQVSFSCKNLSLIAEQKWVNKEHILNSYVPKCHFKYLARELMDTKQLD
jgi:hypothetical protein